jgi:hypothetical protein
VLWLDALATVFDLVYPIASLTKSAIDSSCLILRISDAILLSEFSFEIKPLAPISANLLVDGG